MTNNALSVPQWTNSPQVSLREQSDSKLQAAIRGHSDEGETLKRINGVLGAFFDPGHDPQTKAAVREEFVRALAGKPQWAVQRAFDAWVRTMNRRPTPAEIVLLVERELQPIAEELSRRRAEQQRIEADREEARRNKVSPEAAARIMAEAGMTEARLLAVRHAPTATRIADLDDAAELRPVADWTKGLPEDDLRMVALRKARAESFIVANGAMK